MKKYAVYTGTKNIYEDMEASAKSLIANSDVDIVHFLIEDNKFPKELPPYIIQCHNVSNQQFFNWSGPNMTSKFSYMAMLRIAYAHIFDSDIHMILSLDCDTFCLDDVSGIWSLFSCDQPYYFSATPEWHKTKSIDSNLMYCNHGVVLYNLDKMRDGKADECIDALNCRRYTYVDQDIGNYLCQGHIYPMPPRYNVNYWTCKNIENETPDPITIIHYAGVSRENWKKEKIVQDWTDISWEDVMSMHTEMVVKHF